jgi:hypothetical protein
MAVKAASLAWGAIACVVGLTGWLIAITIVLSVLDGRDVKTVSLVPPLNGDIDLIAGTGIAVVPDVASNSIEVENTGVVTINGLSASAPTQNIVIAVTSPGLSIASAGSTITLTNGGVTQAVAGTGIGVSAAVGNVTFSNTGVLSVGAGLGIAVTNTTGALTASNTGVVTVNGASAVLGDIVIDAGPGITVTTLAQVVTVADTISTETTYPKTNSSSPTVSYTILIGTATAVPVNTWRIGPAVGFPNPWFPGSADDGYGNQVGVAWAVPFGSVGLFAVSVNCEISPNVIAIRDMQTASIALCMGAISEDPFAGGIVLNGGYATLSLAGGANSGTAPALPRQLSVNAIFQAGCSGCPVQGGDALTLHARMDHTGTGVGPYTMTAFCTMTVSHLR